MARLDSLGNNFLTSSSYREYRMVAVFYILIQFGIAVTATPSVGVTRLSRVS